jgi:hypothetical protein
MKTIEDFPEYPTPEVIDNLKPEQAVQLLLSTNGFVKGVENSKSNHPVDVNTMVVMTPNDADFFADGYLKGLSVAPGRWSVLWQNVYDLPTGQNVAIQVNNFQSSAVPVEKAVILVGVATSSAEVRSMVLFAVDNGVRLEHCRVVCGQMAQSVFDELKHDFGDEWAETAMAGMVVGSDDVVNSIPVPTRDLAYMPKRVSQSIND